MAYSCTIIVENFTQYLTLRSTFSLNNPQNNEYKVDMLKIILIIIGYTMHKFISHITIL